MSKKKPVIITQGDSAGIGPEIIALAFRDVPGVMRGCMVVGHVETMRRAAQCIEKPGAIGMPVVQCESLTDAYAVPVRAIPVLSLPQLPGPQPFGVVSSLSGKAAVQCIEWAAQQTLAGNAAAVVTAPIHKEALAAAGVPYPGHTELLQAQAAMHAGLPAHSLPVRMMLANQELRTVLVSIHVALKAAIDAVTTEAVLETLQITHTALSQLLKRAPRIAVAGLNPHAGEGGLFGCEEKAHIIPAIHQAQQLGINATGPYAADTVFMRARQTPLKSGEFDVVVAMYHDQGLIPVKYLGVDQGVNVTLGLPMVRTSPDHGTAFDIAGKGIASPESFIEAVRMAKQISA